MTFKAEFTQPNSWAMLKKVTLEENKEKLEQLVRQDIDFGARDEKGNTMLMLAMRFAGTEFLKALILASKKYINARNDNGETALMLAVAFDRADVLEDVLGAGASPGAVNCDGHTAQYLGEFLGRPACLDILEADRTKKQAEDPRLALLDRTLDYVWLSPAEGGVKIPYALDALDLANKIKASQGPLQAVNDRLATLLEDMEKSALIDSYTSRGLMNYAAVAGQIELSLGTTQRKARPLQPGR